VELEVEDETPLDVEDVLLTWPLDVDEVLLT